MVRGQLFGRRSPRVGTLLGVLVAIAAPALAGSVFEHERAWEVVTVEGRLFPAEFRAAVDKLTVSRVSGGVLQPIPFQIDERDSHGRFALPDGPSASQDESPGVFDENDLLVFAARDVGEQAAVPDAAEIRVTDPLTGQSGWVYLRRHRDADHTEAVATHDQVARDTVAGSTVARGAVAYDGATDTVHTSWYTLTLGAHTASAFAFVGADGRPGRNLLDRLKARVTAHILWGLIEFRRTEDDITTTVLAWKVGPVRMIRRARLSVNVGYGLSPPKIVMENFLTADTFEGPVVIRLPFDLRYVFGDITMHIYLDFGALDGHRIFTANREPVPVGCGLPVPDLNDLPADWFGMTGPLGSFVEALRVGRTLQTVQRRLYVTASRTPDPPEGVPGNCPGVGYTLTGWRGIGRGTHQLRLVVRAFDHFTPGDERPFLASFDHPLTVSVATARAGARMPGVEGGLSR